MTLARQQQRRDTAANWELFNPVLLDGEIGYDKDADRIKIGDGITAWVDLGYADELEASQQAVTDAQAQVLAAQSAAAAAAASAAQVAEAEAITVPADAVAYVSRYTPAVVEALVQAYGPHKHPLFRATKDINGYASPKVTRLLLSETSIGTFDPSGIQVFAQQACAVYGEAATTREFLGVQGGDFGTAVSGWHKQRYGGGNFTRIVGDSSSTTNTVIQGYGDTLTLEVSREETSQAVNVKVDGTVVGQTTGPGSQLYRTQVSVTVPMGVHTMTVDAPTGDGKVFLESAFISDSTRRDGIEILDYGLGGTGLKHMTTLYNQPPEEGSNQVPGIPIVGNAGRDYYFNRGDVDLFIIEGPVNDGGDVNAMATLDFAVEQARLRDIPVIIVVEPVANYPLQPGYQAAREHMLLLGRLPWVTTVDWHAMLWPGQDLLDASLIPEFLHLYFADDPYNPHPVVAAHQILTSALCTIAGLPLPKLDSMQMLAHRRLHALRADPYRGPARQATIARHTYDLGTAEGTAVSCVNPVGPSVLNKALNYYRVALVAPQRDLFNQSAPTWLENPTGTDQWGSYGTGIADGGGVVDNGQLMRITARVGYAGGTMSVRFSSAYRLEDDLGNQRPLVGGFTQESYGLRAGEPPVVLTWLARVVDNTQPTLPTLGACKVYEATCLPVDSAAVPPILDAARTSTSWLRDLRAADTHLQAVLIGATTRRFAQPYAAAFEVRNVSGATDLYTGVQYDGETVPLYRDTTVPQLLRQGDGGGGFSLPERDVNLVIAAEPSGTDAGGKYLNQNYTEWGIQTAVAGEEFQVSIRQRSIVIVRPGQNCQIVVNGQVRTADLGLYAGNDEVTWTPFWTTFRIRAIADGRLSISVRPTRMYAMHGTRTSHPLITL